MLFLAGSAAFAQNPTFEVASIKPTAPQEMGRIMVRMGGDPGRIDYVNVSLRDLIRQAYAVKDYQISGPDWLTSARFDVQAKYPPDTPVETRNLMMQALLAERFSLKVHKESKETQTYSLVVGKNGHKLKKADPNKLTTMLVDGPGGPGTSDRNVRVAPGAPASGPAAGGGGGGTWNTAGAPTGAGMRLGAPAGGAAGPGGGGRGMTMMRMEGHGKLHMTSMGTALPNFAEMLARQVGKPVFDETKLEGLFDIDLEFKPESGSIAGMRMAGPGMAHPEGVPSGPAPEAVEAPSIFTAVQDQLGLKLESKKGPIETIVVDSANKTPTEN
jgi:uncharacterized protein (TIGR03435 family)